MEIIDELIRVLEKKFKVDPELTRDYVLRLNELSDIVTPRKLPGKLVRDREDVKVIECAHSGHSDYIVTGDRDLLSLKRYQQTRILSPRELVKILSQRLIGLASGSELQQEGKHTSRTREGEYGQT